MRSTRNLFLALIFALAFVGTAAADEARGLKGWIKSYAAAPLEAGDLFEAPDYHGTLIEMSARRAVEERLVALGYEKAAAPAADILTISISVKEPAPKGRKPLPKSPIQIASQDRSPYDNIYDPELRAEWVDVEKRRKDAADELTVTIYARRGEERIWSGYAGAALDGASRDDVAHGLVDALLDHFGAAISIENAPIALAGGASPIIIIEPTDTN